MGNQPYHDAETLRDLYHRQNLTQSEIADKFDVSAVTISDWMSRHDIETRGGGGGNYGPRHDDDRLYDPEYLHTEYVSKGRTSREIADELGCGKKAVLRQLEGKGIEKRPNKKRVDDKRVYEREFLEREYVEKEKSSRQIAKDVGCSKDVVLRQLKQHNIRIRDTSEATSLGMDKGRCGFHTSKRGYEKATTRDPERAREVGIHQLVAIAEGANPHRLFTGSKSDGNHAHHKNRIPWDNRPCNIKIMSNSEHQKEHMDEFTRDEKGRINGVDRSGA